MSEIQPELRPVRQPRVSFTRKHTESGVVAELLTLLATVTADGTITDIEADAKRRSFPARVELRIIKAADAAKGAPGVVGALLRCEGLFSSHLATWRNEGQTSLLQALAPKARGPKSKRDPQAEELQKLRRENQRLT